MPAQQPQQPQASAQSQQQQEPQAVQPGQQVPPPPQGLPPYYQLSLPVYSLASVGPDGGSPTMNLVTYASPISLKPRHYALGLYRDTLSWQNMMATRTGVLQILGEHHAPLFELLGRSSGRDVDKLAELARRGFPLTRHPADGTPLLADSCGWMLLRFAAEPVSCGDHDVVVCEVVDWHTPPAGAAATAHGAGAAAAEAAAAGAPGQQPLYTGNLRQLGLLP